MRVAHLGLIGAVLLTACGGRLGSEPSPEITQVSGFHSYEATITGVSVSMMGGGPRPTTTSSPSEGRSFRMDLERSETVRAVFAGSFGDAVLAESGVTGTVKLSADHLVSFTGATSSGGATWETWKSVTLNFDAAGRPVDGTMEGELSVSEGDVIWMGALTAKVTFAPDETAPTFRASSSAGFASVALPWDDRTIEASEPYANTLNLPAFLGKDAGKWRATPLTQKTWVGDTTRGYLLRLLDWDAPLPLSVATPAASDLEGNVAANAGSMKLEGRSVARRAVPYLRFDDYAGAATSWGAAKPSTSCRSGTSCIEIGPFRASYCNTGSKGGIATRLPGGTGIVNATVRMTGKRIASYGGGSVPPGMIKLAVARPGEVPVVAPDSDLHPTITDGGLDTGWVKISAVAPGGSETGIALGVGGTGVASGCYGYPMPEEWELTVYVDAIEMMPRETK